MPGPEWVAVAVELAAADGHRVRIEPDLDPVHPWRIGLSDPGPVEALRAGVADGVVHARALRVVLEIPGIYRVVQQTEP